ncbi:MAG: hypothetical protein H7Y43_04415 [Akkermansiaceae bacterium]|nr:hypothetical protein [Verrucomicrobiales bacterium]
MERTVVGMLLAKIESAYGTDPTPTTAANLIAVARSSVNFNAQFDHLARMILDGTLGKVAGHNVLPRITLSFDVEMRGNRTTGATDTDITSGASAQAVEIDPLLRACDLAATYTAETTDGARDGYVTYKPTVPSDEGASVTFYFYSGSKLHKITGAKGNLKASMTAGQMGVFSFEFSGLYNAPTDASIPGSPVWLDTKPPTFIAAGSTVGSFTPVFQKLDFDLGNQVQRRDDANAASGVKGFIIANRDAKCSIDPESVAEATHPIWADLASATPRTITAVLGNQAGNRIQATLAGVSEAVSYGDRNGIRTQPINYSIERALISDAAGSELAMKFY